MLTKNEILANLREYSADQIADAINSGVVTLYELSKTGNLTPLMRKRISEKLTACNSTLSSENKESENNGVENQEGIIINEDKRSLEVNNGEFEKENKLSRENSNNIYQNNITIPFEKKKNKKPPAKKKKEEVVSVTDEEVEDDEMFCFREGEYILGEGEKIIASWTF